MNLRKLKQSLKSNSILSKIWVCNVGNLHNSKSTWILLSQSTGIV